MTIVTIHCFKQIKLYLDLYFINDLIGLGFEFLEVMLVSKMLSL